MVRYHRGKVSKRIGKQIHRTNKAKYRNVKRNGKWYHYYKFDKK